MDCNKEILTYKVENLNENNQIYEYKYIKIDIDNINVDHYLSINILKH